MDKWHILTEIGRVCQSHGDDDAKTIALRICELKPKAKDAVRMIRQWRTGKRAKGKASRLLKEIVQTINDYLQRHPETSLVQVDTALVAALGMVREDAMSGLTLDQIDPMLRTTSKRDRSK
jgi:ribosomal protein L31E